MGGKKRSLAVDIRGWQKDGRWGGVYPSLSPYLLTHAHSKLYFRIVAKD